MARFVLAAALVCALFVGLEAASTPAIQTAIDECKANFQNEVGGGTDACTSLQDLKTCVVAIQGMATIDQATVLGYLDAARLFVSCPSFVLPTFSVPNPLPVDDSYLNLQVTRSADIKFFRQMSAESLGFWELSQQLSNVAAQLENFATPEDIDDAKASLNTIVNANVATLEQSIADITATVTADSAFNLNGVLAAFQALTATIHDMLIRKMENLSFQVYVGTKNFNYSNNMYNNLRAEVWSNFSQLMAGTSAQISSQQSVINTIPGTLDSFSTVISSGVRATITNMTATIASVSSQTSSVFATLAPTPLLNKKLPVYRWAIWSTYSQNYGWFANNQASLFGGQNPSNWGDGNAYASSMTADKNQLRALFSKRGFGGWSTTVWAEEWYYYSSTNSRHTGVLLRIRNTQPTAITWVAYWMFSAYGGWGEAASVALNGVDQYTTTTSCAYCTASISLTFPANRVSTAIFVCGSGPPSSTRSLYFGFYNDCLNLPAGLEYVDDMDYAVGGWNE